LLDKLTPYPQILRATTCSQVAGRRETAPIEKQEGGIVVLWGGANEVAPHFDSVSNSFCPLFPAGSWLRNRSKVNSSLLLLRRLGDAIREQKPKITRLQRCLLSPVILRRRYSERQLSFHNKVFPSFSVEMKRGKLARRANLQSRGSCIREQES